MTSGSRDFDIISLTMACRAPTGNNALMLCMYTSAFPTQQRQSTLDLDLDLKIKLGLACFRSVPTIFMMSLKTLYQSYLANPSAAALSDHASLNYIPTLTTINTAASIVKHNTAHQKVLKKREERIIDCIESSNAITLDVETTLEFMAGGGAYLPGLDDNFVADRVVSFPMVSTNGHASYSSTSFYS